MNVYVYLKDNSYIYEEGNYIELQYNSDELVSKGFLIIYDKTSNSSQLGILVESTSSILRLRILKKEFKLDAFGIEIKENTDNGDVIDVSNKSEKNNFGEIFIRSVNEFLEIINLFEIDKNILFRGQSDLSFKLEPSIYRKNYTESKEAAIYKEIIKNNLKEINSGKMLLDNVVNMQHIGVSTRLLDWTSNPLISLFFAVSENEDKDAYVFAHIAEKIYNFNDEVYRNISIILEDYFKINNITESDKEVISFIKDIMEKKQNYIFIETTYNNSRIRAQQGYFSILLEIRDKYIKCLKKGILDSVKYSKCIEQPFLRKLADFDFRGKNDKEIEDYIKNINIIPDKRGEWNSGKFLEYLKVKKFFSLNKEELNKTYIELNNDICKFIIPSEYKRLIRKQLNLLGINHENIYPDIQGLVLHIKDKYESMVL
ncbi:FRG domain-containing protein [Clostridium intestinale]|uniref:FRG domain-containing protein n=1 Tax=Clostridium intestinale TaxID=36845 RepID=A0A7D6VSU1_9CLOT|nr:FRG domain-containing protein [Clostridium intestinale]QLY81229.1 FRG domain-containing protein [Clostridium intestinale]